MPGASSGLHVGGVEDEGGGGRGRRVGRRVEIAAQICAALIAPQIQICAERNRRDRHRRARPRTATTTTATATTTATTATTSARRLRSRRLLGRWRQSAVGLVLSLSDVSVRRLGEVRGRGHPLRPSHLVLSLGGHRVGSGGRPPPQHLRRTMGLARAGGPPLWWAGLARLCPLREQVVREPDQRRWRDWATRLWRHVQVCCSDDGPVAPPVGGG